ncbi:FAD-binding oxidoreductase [Nocardioides mesophilus]|uniref:Delta(24)-sterol reductase n=1 Tax=Nocardioides mesophilus TaxID=433659 RepID=A0A7G9RGQ6_9ACTN|nr:FAD-binding oxidoreductase [Nocardioides mesophilus]
MVGPDRHAAAVHRLQASYDAIPAGAPVRLAKSTSNLFRTRSRSTAPGLDVSGLTGVIDLDPLAGTADVQGMCTYEDLVDVTLPRGFIPYVVPQLRTITLGGAVSGLGIESTSFRNGLPHESVLEMDVLTGDGQVRTVRPGDDLFDAFPNSYGSLGYATRLRIRLERVPNLVELRHVRFDDLEELARVTARIVDAREHDGVRVDAVDGVVFEPTEACLTLARFADDAPVGATPPLTSDYTGPEPFYRSLQRLEVDRLTMHDYLWRWDTDWFWCSGAFGLHDPRVRRLWPRRWRRSDVYHRLVGLETRYGLKTRLDRRRGLPERERVIQDVEVPVERLAEFLTWFDENVGMRPVWLCPLRSTREWPSYPLKPGATYVNVGFWGTVPIGPGARDGDKNRAVEAEVTDLGGHKSLYSDAYYDRETFDSLYDQSFARRVRKVTDPDGRLTELYEKAVGRR